MDEVNLNGAKVNLNEMRRDLMEQTEKLHEMKTTMMTMAAKLDKMEDIKQKVDQLAALPGIQNTQEEIKKDLEEIKKKFSPTSNASS